MAFLKNLIEKPITGEWGTDGDEVNVLRTTNFTNSGALDLSSVIKRNISEKKVEQKKLLKGDIIIEKSGGSPKQPVGRVVFFDEKGVYLCNNFTSILRPKKGKVEPKYLHYLLYSSHRFGITGMFQNKTTGILNLQLSRYVNKLEIPLPTLKIQQRIVGILDDAAALRDKTEKLLIEYDLLAQSIYSAMFGDPFNNQKNFERGTIRDLAKEAKYGTSSKAGDEGEFIYLRMNNITFSGYMDYEKLKYVDILKKDLPKYIVRKGDILFNRTNSRELVGKTAVFDSDTNMIAAGYLIRVRLNKKGNPYFIWGYLNSKHGKLILNNMCKNIVGMANIICHLLIIRYSQPQ